MLWSIPIGTIAGTVVRIHVTFLLFLVWIGAAQWRVGGREAALEGVVFLVLIFACVLAHEFGHIFAARRYGIRTPEVTLWPIGGVASLERIPEKPSEELVVALAGPAVNVVIALAIVLVLGATLDEAVLTDLENPRAQLLARVAAANVFLVVFNLIPAFPMDGGRVLRALLAMRMGRAEATRVAARIGQGAAFLFALAGLFVNPMLIVIGLFVYLAATAEAQHVAFRDGTQGLSVRDAMMTPVETLEPGATLSDAVDLLLRTAQKEFPIVDGFRPPARAPDQGRADRRAARGGAGLAGARQHGARGSEPAGLASARGRACDPDPGEGAGAVRARRRRQARRRDHPGERRRDDAGAQRAPGFPLPASRMATRSGLMLLRRRRHHARSSYVGWGPRTSRKGDQSSAYPREGGTAGCLPVSGSGTPLLTVAAMGRSLKPRRSARGPLSGRLESAAAAARITCRHFHSPRAGRDP